MLIRSILRWKTAPALKRSCNFSRAKIERINTVARHVLLQNCPSFICVRFGPKQTVSCACPTRCWNWPSREESRISVRNKHFWQITNFKVKYVAQNIFMQAECWYIAATRQTASWQKISNPYNKKWVTGLCTRSLVLLCCVFHRSVHYSDVTINVMASRITSIYTVCSVVSSGVHQRKHQIYVSMFCVIGTHRCILLKEGQ